MKEGSKGLGIVRLCTVMRKEQRAWTVSRRVGYARGVRKHREVMGNAVETGFASPWGNKLCRWRSVVHLA